MQQLKILLVDDDHDDYALTKSYLRKDATTEYKLDWVEDYNQAKKLLYQQSHDVYLIDYRLDINTGLNLIEEVYSKPQLHKPVIVLTGQEIGNVDLQSLKSGATDYLLKSELNPAVLKKAIHYAIERYKSLCSLFEQKQQNNNFFEQSVDALFLMNSQMLLTQSNQAFNEIIGSTSQNVINTALKNLFVSEDVFTEFENKLKNKTKIKRFEAQLQHSDGNTRICLLSCSTILQLDGSIESYQGMIRDVTEQRKIDEEKKLTEKYAMTHRMSRMIAHEVRNPLTNINLAISQLSNIHKDDTETGAQTYLSIIERNSKRINELINHLMRSSMPAELQLELIDVNKVIKDAIAKVDDRAELNQVSIQTELDQNIPQINADYSRLSIVFTNLLVNGIEAIDKPKGIVHISSNYIEAKKAIQICINDNGLGMDNTTLKHLFEPFYTNKKSGNGLGLASVRNIILAHNAKISVKSKLNLGSTFTINFKV